jgi:hypothetical protein
MNVKLAKIIFSDENTFNFSRHVSQHKVIMWGSNIALAVLECKRKGLKFYAFLSSTQTEVYGSSIFDKHSVL